MLQRLDHHIADALARAAAAEQRGAVASDRLICDDYEELAKSWRHLAETYQFVETLERFLLDAKHSRDEPPRLEAAE